MSHMTFQLVWSRSRRALQWYVLNNNWSLMFCVDVCLLQLWDTVVWGGEKEGARQVSHADIGINGVQVSNSALSHRCTLSLLLLWLNSPANIAVKPWHTRPVILSRHLATDNVSRQCFHQWQCHPTKQRQMTTGRQRPPDGSCRGLYTDIMSLSADSLATNNVGTPDTWPMSVTVSADSVTSKWRPADNVRPMGCVVGFTLT